MIHSHVIGKDRDSPKAVFQHIMEVKRNYVDPPWPVYSTRRYYQDHKYEQVFSPGIGLYLIAMESRRYFQVGSDMELLRVNKQIHKEASDVLYKENAFHFRLFDKRMIPMSDALLPYWRIP
jgi:hypothetical protein